MFLPHTLMYQYPGYLDFRDRLAQVWIHPWVVMLVMVIIKLYLFKVSLLHSLKLLQQYVVVSVDLFNSYAKRLSRVPEDYGTLANRLIVDNINNIKAHSLYFLLLMLTVFVSAVLFVIELLLGTILCLVSLLLEGIVDMVTDLVTEFLEMVNTIAKAASVLIQQGLEGLTEVIDGVADTINSVTSFFTGDEVVDASGFIEDINSAITAISNITIPSRVFLTIDSLQTMIPDLDDFQDDALDELASPINSLILKLNTSVSFDSLEPLVLDNNTMRGSSAEISTKGVIEFFGECNSRIDNVYFIIALSLGMLMVLVMVMVGFKEYFDWKKLFNMYLDLSESKSNEFQFLNTINIYTNSVLYYLSIKLKVHLNDKTVWLISYTLSPSSLFLLSFIVLGLLTVAIEYLMLNQFKSLVNLFPMSEITSQSGSVNQTFTGFLKNTNTFITLQLNQLNEELFGSITNTTAKVSTAIDLFVSGMNSTLLESFNSTYLQSAMSTVVYCILVRKLDMVNNGMKWIQDNLHIEIPEISSSTFENLSVDSPSLELKLQEQIDDIIEWYHKSMIIELILVGGVGGIWLLLVLVGVIMMLLRKRVQISWPKPLKKHQRIEYGMPFDEIY